MHISYITYARMPTEKAHGLQIASMLEAFLDLGHTVELITPEAEKNPIPLTVQSYYRLRHSLPHRVVLIPNVVGLSKRPTPLHHYFNEFFFVMRCLFVSLPKESLVYTRSASLVRIFTLRGYRVVCEQHFWPEKASRIHAFFLRPAVAIPCNSQGTYEACVRHGLTQAFVAQNAIDVTLFEHVETKADARARLGLPHDAKIAMYVGSLEKWKGVETLCKAALLTSDIQVVVIGGKRDDVATLQARYPHVTFLGQRPYYELPNNQQAADVLVVPNDPSTTESERYTSPIKLFAHMASGVPTLVSDLPSMRAIAGEDMLAFFMPGSPEALAKGIERVLHDEEAPLRAQKARDRALRGTWQERARTILTKVRMPQS